MGAMERGNEVTRVVDMGNLGPPITIEHRLCCRTSNVVYIAKDLQDGKLYAGETKREVRARLSEHVSSIENVTDASAVGKHFNRMNHAADKLVMVPIVKVTGGTMVRKSIERVIINRYDLINSGMNEKL